MSAETKPFTNGEPHPVSQGDLIERLTRLEDGHLKISQDISEVRVLVAKSDGKLETLLSLSEARRADEQEREKLLHEARMEIIKSRPIMIKAIGTAVAAVIAAAVYGILH
jgi:uncharacterized protein (UPF0335 family)